MQAIKINPEDILDEEHISPGIINYLTSSGIHDFQRYHGGLRRFAPQESLTLNSGFIGYDILDATLPPQDLPGRIWQGHLRSRKAALEPVYEGKVYSKIIHLVDPFEFMQRSHILSYMPSPDASDRDRLRKHAISRYNQASVDATICYILSCIGDRSLTPATVKYYETVCGVAENYLYRITDDYETLRNKRWFWSYAEDGKLLVVDGEDVSDEVKQWVITKPSDEELDQFDDEEYEEEIIMADSMYRSAPESPSDATGDQTFPEAQVQLEEFSFNMEDLSLEEPEVINKKSSDNNSVVADEEQNEEITLMEELENSNGEIYLKCKNIPVLVCFQEAAEGTMDGLLCEMLDAESDTDSAASGIFGLQEAERQWSAWLFQICAALSVLQKYVNFCHNDLHANNIVWTSTTDEYLYYKSADGTLYKVPTYGKIFKLIDFGRATAEIGGIQLISTDYETGQDAWGQYNWGPIKDPELSTVAPNQSFDLCRLAVSLFESLYPGYDPEEDKDTSPLADMMWSWMIDDEGKTVLYDENDDERFTGFDLYIHIGQHICNAIPAEQFKHRAFSQFKWRGKAARAASSAAIKTWPIITETDSDDLDETTSK